MGEISVIFNKNELMTSEEFFRVNPDIREISRQEGKLYITHTFYDKPLMVDNLPSSMRKLIEQIAKEYGI